MLYILTWMSSYKKGRWLPHCLSYIDDNSQACGKARSWSYKIDCSPFRQIFLFLSSTGLSTLGSPMSIPNTATELAGRILLPWLVEVELKKIQKTLLCNQYKSNLQWLQTSAYLQQTHNYIIMNEQGKLCKHFKRFGFVCINNTNCYRYHTTLSC